MIDEFASICLTKLDVLSGLKTIKVGRKYMLNGKELPTMPAEHEDLAKVEVVYDELPGWEEDITGYDGFLAISWLEFASLKTCP